MGAKYPVAIETEIHTKDFYNSDEWKKTGLPVAPGLIIGDEVIPIGSEVLEDEIERLIQARL